MNRIDEIKKDIYKAFENELLKKRQQKQVDAILIKSKQKDHLVEKFAHELVKNNLDYRINDYVAAQFFSLNYMPYLPTIVMICSSNGFIRWEKVKHYYKYIDANINYKKVKKRRTRTSYKDDEIDLLDLKKVQDFEEVDKKIFYNDVRGFDLCLSNDILFNIKSDLCRACKFRSHCLKILKVRFFPLFQYRLNLITDKTYLRKMKLLYKEEIC